MYELIAAGERSYYIDSPTKVGIITLEDHNVCLIDSGSHRDTAKRVDRILTERGWKPAMILNTHSHADHIGGNQLFQERYGCKIYASAIEAGLITHTALQPAFIYGGFPCKPLRGKFFLAQPSETLPLEDCTLPQGFEVIPLEGHSPAMIGVRAPDGVCFIGDSVSSAETLEKYHLPFVYDVAAHLATLERLQTLEGRLFVPAHAAAADHPRPLALLNRQNTLDNLALIVSLCQTPCAFEPLLTRIFNHYGITMDFAQYALVGNTVRSYLSYLSDNNKIEPLFSHNTLTWSTKSDMHNCANCER